ncbi:MAG TPA: amino acid permease [Chloroflexia bacterium]|nr:amino acid permease [Chloroflexia bacterium]
MEEGVSRVLPATRVAGESQKTKSRKLGLVSSTSLVIGSMIGSGVFLLPTSLAPFGGISIVGWLFTAVGAILLALVFAKLSSIVPKTGGPYIYTRLAFGDFIGFWIAWGYWIGTWTANAAISVAFVSYLNVFFPALAGNNFLSAIVALALVWLLTWVNTRGVKQVGIVQTITTIIKLTPLVAIALLGLFWVHWDNVFVPATGNQSPVSAISSVAALTLFSFLGLETATIPGDEINNPKVTIPRATVFGTILTALVYILGTVAVMGVVPRDQLGHSSAPFADAAKSMWGNWAYFAVGFGAVVSCLGALNGQILTQGQVPMAAAHDHLFPTRFGKVSKNAVPTFSLVLSSILISALIVLNYSGFDSATAAFNFIILLATTTTLVPYAFCAMAELMLFIEGGKEFNGQRLFGSSIIAMLAFAYALWLVYGSGSDAVLWGFILLLLGTPVYVWQRKQQAGQVDLEQAGMESTLEKTIQETNRASEEKLAG